ncbi:MAG TPA: hypothetical protein DG414_09015 [Gammaproteobacteria bacterium]|nr:hypothetical protein [Gammaproteobacteria bacterium]
MDKPQVIPAAPIIAEDVTAVINPVQDWRTRQRWAGSIPPHPIGLSWPSRREDKWRFADEANTIARPSLALTIQKLQENLLC